MTTKPAPRIIQGGMGIAVSAWQLARAVARAGQLGVVSGTGIDIVLARRLQLGDPDGQMRQAIAAFPIREIGERVLARYYIPGGKHPDEPFRPFALPSAHPTPAQLELLVVANFAEVYLAKLGHTGEIGVNFLEKIQTPLLPSLFGAMLAGVDYVLMGAGIPRAIPGYLDRLSQGESCTLRLEVAERAPNAEFDLHFDPRPFLGDRPLPLARPKFLAIVSSDTLATMLARKATGHVDGFIVENATAGGHNAPPRGTPQWNERGEPIYGPRDAANIRAIRELGRPFWLAGSYGSPAQLQAALNEGAAGIQVGTAFAFCEESGMRDGLKRRVLEMARQGTLDVVTDPVASPTGFPFKILQLPGTLSQVELQAERRRQCDLGYLRHAYQRADGSLGWRCPAERAAAYVQKGGAADDTIGRQCLCNALLANVGLGQTRADGTVERPLVTSGDDVCQILRFLPTADAASYTAHDVISHLLSCDTRVPAAESSPTAEEGSESAAAGELSRPRRRTTSTLRRDRTQPVATPR